MSGRKTVEISTYEYHSLQTKARNADSAARSIAKLQEVNRALQVMNQQRDNRIQKETARLQAKVSELQRRSTQESQALRRQLEENVATIKQQIDRQAAINTRNMDQMRRAFETKLTQTNTRITDLTHTVEHNRQQVEQEIHTMKEEFHKSISSLTARLDRADADARSLLECAETYLDFAESVIDSARSFRCELLLPNEWKALLNSRKRAVDDINLARHNPANAAVARSNAHALHEQSLEFYNAIIAAEQEWQVHYEAAVQQLALANAKLRESRTVNLADEDYDVDVSFWGNCELNGIAQSLSQAEQTLQDHKDSLTVSDLDGLSSLGDELRKQTEDAVVHAVGAAYGSQERIDKASEISDMLYRRFGLEVEDCCYRGDDMRCAYRFRAMNPVTRYEVIVTLTPRPKDDGTTSMECECETVNYGDNDNDNAVRIAHDIGEAVMKLLTGGDMSEVKTDHAYDNRPSDRAHMTRNEWKTQQLTREEIPAFQRKKTGNRRTTQTAQ